MEYFAEFGWCKGEDVEGVIAVLEGRLWLLFFVIFAGATANGVVEAALLRGEFGMVSGGFVLEHVFNELPAWSEGY